jgi:hypothetical protein
MDATPQSLKGICVAIRIRPLNEREISGGQEAVFGCMSLTNSVVQLKEGQTIDSYYYDKDFDPQSRSTTTSPRTS